MSRISNCRRVGACEGFTLLELIFICAVIALLSAIAIPTVFRSRLAANETSVLGTLHGVHTAQLTYSLTCGFGNFAESFPTLGGPSEFLPPDMTTGPAPRKSGYTYTLQPGPSGPSIFTDCNGAAMATEYYLTAEPLAIGETGNRGFASNQAHTIWQDMTGVAPAEPFVAGGTVTPIQ
jgi:type IV pilus assembly protein PilA